MSDDVEVGEEVLNQGENHEAPDAVEGSGAPAVTLGRVLSLARLASLLGRTRNTITSWLETEGAPYVRRGDTAKAQTWLIDVAEFVKWMEARAAAKAKGGDDDDVDWDQMKTLNTPRALEYRQLRAKTDKVEREDAASQRSLARIQPLLQMMATDRAALSDRVMGIARQVADKDLIDLDKALNMRIEDAINKHARAALSALKADEELMEKVLELADSDL